MAMAAEPAAGGEQKPSTQTIPQAATAPVQKPTQPQQAPPATTAAAPQLLAEPPKLQLNVPTVTTAQPQAAPAVLIGYVDPVKISTDSAPGKAGQARLINMKKKLQSQIEAKRKQLDKQRDAIEAKLNTFTPAQRDAKTREFKKKVEEFQKFGQKAENELQELQVELSNNLYEKIQKAADVYAKKTNLALVIVKREVIYQSEGVVPMDITDEIIKLVNAEGPKK